MSATTPNTLLMLLGLALFAPAGALGQIAYVGGYTKGKPGGIATFRFDAGSGELTPLGLAAATPDPSFLAWGPGERVLYAVNEPGGGGEGVVSAFAHSTGQLPLRFINRQPSGGTSPCHVVVVNGAQVVIANYGTGSLAGYPIRTSDGGLGKRSYLIPYHGSGPNPARQTGPHAHCVVPDPSGRFLLSCDLGTDRVMLFRLSPDAAEPVPADPPYAKVAPGAGPRHVAFSPDGTRAYVADEIASTVTVFSWNADAGTLELLQTISTLPPGWRHRNTAAEIQLSPDGSAVYVSNRGHDSIARFRRAADGRLAFEDTTPCGGKTPRFFTQDPSGAFLLCANQDSDNIQVFRRDAASGALTSVGPAVSTPSPTCIVFASP